MFFIPSIATFLKQRLVCVIFNIGGLLRKCHRGKCHKKINVFAKQQILWCKATQLKLLEENPPRNFCSALFSKVGFGVMP